jgi:hypothetical protein
VLWILYSAGLVIRLNLDDNHRRAQLSGILAIAGLVDIPFVMMSTRWFRGIHPVSPEMDPTMTLVLASTVAAYTGFFALLLYQRQRQLKLAHDVATLVHVACHNVPSRCPLENVTPLKKAGLDKALQLD